jgi:hypothetical protein
MRMSECDLDAPKACWYYVDMEPFGYSSISMFAELFEGVVDS